MSKSCGGFNSAEPVRESVKLLKKEDGSLQKKVILQSAEGSKKSANAAEPVSFESA